MVNASGEFPDIFRRTLRVLALSINGTPVKDKLAGHLNSAADNGSSQELEHAKALFKTLTPEERAEIQEKSENQATSSAAMRRILLDVVDPAAEDGS
jgi:hypothetical protein